MYKVMLPRFNAQLDIESVDFSKMEQWAQELRSGKYHQGNGVLHEGGRFCCLGVLGVELLNYQPQGSFLCDAEGTVYGSFIKTTDFDTMIDGVRRDRYGSQHVQGFFAGLNDSQELTFEQIADVIDEIVQQIKEQQNA